MVHITTDNPATFHPIGNHHPPHCPSPSRSCCRGGCAKGGCQTLGGLPYRATMSSLYYTVTSGSLSPPNVTRSRVPAHEWRPQKKIPGEQPLYVWHKGLSPVLGRLPKVLPHGVIPGRHFAYGETIQPLCVTVQTQLMPLRLS